MLVRTKLIMLFILAIASSALSQLVNRVDKYSLQQGLTDADVRCIYQDKKGFIWVGTSWGLNRYDGKQFKQYLNTGSNGMLDLDIGSIAEDLNGNLWLGTGCGITRFSPQTEEFVNYPGYSTRTYVDKNNDVWAGSYAGVTRLNRTNGVFDTFPTPLAAPNSTANKYILDFLEDSKGRFWISTSYGVKLFDRRTNKITSYHLPSQAGDDIVNACTGLFEDSDKNIWVGKWSSGLMLYNEQQDKFEQKKFLSDNDATNFVFSVRELKLKNNNYLVAATSNGCVLFKKEPGNHSIIHPLQVVSEGIELHHLSSRVTSFLLSDRQNNLWVGTVKGLNKIDPDIQNFKWIALPGLETEAIFHLVKPKNSSTKAYLTTMKGWFNFDLVTHKIEPSDIRGGELLNYINRYVETDSGAWFTSMKGFGFINFQTGKIKDYSQYVCFPNNNKTYGIIRDVLGRLWITLPKQGIRIFEPASLKLRRFMADSSQTHNLVGRNIFAFKQDSNNHIWISTDQFMYRVNPLTLDYRVYKNHVEGKYTYLSGRKTQARILFDNSGRMLVYHDETVYEFRGEKLSLLYPLNNHTPALISSINCDKNNNYWVQTNNGFFKVSADFKQWTSFTQSTGLDGAVPNLETYVHDQNDVYVLSTGRLLNFDAGETSTQTSSTNLLLNAIRVNNKQQQFPQLHNIVVPYQKTLDLNFSYLNFKNEGANKILYRLVGWNNDWIEAKNGQVRFEGLPFGNFKLMVKAGNEGIDAGKTMTLSFRVQPPFYFTWWFILVNVAVISVVAYLFYRYRLKQAIKLERLRTRIATDLHDDIGATLSSISIYSEAIRQQVKDDLPHLSPILKRMGESSREVVSSMSDIVWTINPVNDSMEKLMHKMQTYGAELCASKNIHYTFNGDESLLNEQIALATRQNIYLIFKESLNNSLKYAKAQHIKASIQKLKKQIVLTITDDGSGFNTQEDSNGNGLGNMKRRAEEIKAHLHLQSSPSGTVIRLLYDIP